MEHPTPHPRDSRIVAGWGFPLPPRQDQLRAEGKGTAPQSSPSQEEKSSQPQSPPPLQKGTPSQPQSPPGQEENVTSKKERHLDRRVLLPLTNVISTAKSSTKTTLDIKRLDIKK
jgi:hypothetical protein